MRFHPIMRSTRWSSRHNRVWSCRKRDGSSLQYPPFSSGGNRPLTIWENLATLQNGDVLISLERVDVRSIGRFTYVSNYPYIWAEDTGWMVRRVFLIVIYNEVSYNPSPCLPRRSDDMYIFIFILWRVWEGLLVGVVDRIQWNYHT